MVITRFMKYSLFKQKIHRYLIKTKIMNEIKYLPNIGIFYFNTLNNFNVLKNT
jgi:hypothetical protein